VNNEVQLKEDLGFRQQHVFQKIYPASRPLTPFRREIGEFRDRYSECPTDPVIFGPCWNLSVEQIVKHRGRFMLKSIDQSLKKLQSET
jgi:hypothetical protein